MRDYGYEIWEKWDNIRRGLWSKYGKVWLWNMKKKRDNIIGGLWSKGGTLRL